MTDKPDLTWARDKIKDFSKLKDIVDATKADERRYRDHPGYVPEFTPTESKR